MLSCKRYDNKNRMHRSRYLRFDMDQARVPPAALRSAVLCQHADEVRL